MGGCASVVLCSVFFFTFVSSVLQVALKLNMTNEAYP
jgi:hypothetical protein